VAAGGNLGRVCTDRLDDLATVTDDRLDGSRHVVDHDVEQQARVRRRWSSDDPCATDLANAVVECDSPSGRSPDPPAEYRLLERGGTLDVDSRNLDVAQLAVA
jgi:hypothetical protein